MRKSCFFVTAVCLAILPQILLSQGPTTREVADTIWTDDTWSEDTIIVTSDVFVPDEVSLTINPGTWVKFSGNTHLKVWGRILAIGTKEDSIVFTSADTSGFSGPDPAAGGWAGILLHNGPANRKGAEGAMSDNDSSLFIHCCIEYVKTERSRHSGIYINNFSRVLVSECLLRYNSHTGFGGGAMNLEREANVTIRNCDFYYNTGTERGGAIYCYSSAATFEENTFRYNQALLPDIGYGGAIYILGSNPVFRNNIVEQNSADHGSGIYLYNCFSLIEGNTIAYNKGINSPHYGGGIACQENSTPLIRNNIIANNYVDASGGGIYCTDSDAEIINNLIVNNTAESGAGICLINSSSLVVNNTVANNKANDGGALCIGESEPRVYNTIFWGNEAPGGSQIKFLGSFSTLTIKNCLLQSGIAGIDNPGTIDHTDILEVNPQFITPSSSAGWEEDGISGNWKISDGSFCVNAGNDVTPIKDIPLYDLAGELRIRHSKIDIGAYEVHIPTIIASAVVSNDTTWIADRVIVDSDIQIMDDAVLTITPGTYIEFQDTFMINVEGTILAIGTQDERITFTVADTSGLHNQSVPDGGWGGLRYDNSDMGANNAMSDNDTSFFRYCDFSYGKAARTTQQQGGVFSIRYYSGLSIDNCTFFMNSAILQGGAIFLTKSKLGIDNCRFSHCNSADGGGVYCEHSNLEIRNSVFEYGYAGSGGGVSSKAGSHLLIDNCEFSYNSCYDPGGGIYTGHTWVTIKNSFINNNTSWLRGGGVCLSFEEIEMSNNVIVNNGAWYGGGAYFRYVDEGYCVNNTISNNWANNGGGLSTYLSDEKHYNDLFFGNIAGESGNQITMETEQSLPGFSHCLIEGGLEQLHIRLGDEFKGEFLNNLDTIPTFIDPSDGVGTGSDGKEADWRLSPVSPCINKGSSSIEGFIMPGTDRYGSDRIFGAEVDIGAYENQYGKPVITKQPLNQVVCTGNEISISVETEAVSHFQWQKDGQNIAGADSNILVFDSVSNAQDGNYQCIVTNSFGSTSTNSIYLIAKSAPEILLMPEDIWAVEGERNIIKTEATGTPPLKFSWYKDGEQIPDKKYPELWLPDTGPDDEGEYICKISNTCGAVWTDPVQLYLAPQLCMVTVDTIEGENKNLVIWEKNTKAPLTGYNIYRESHIAGDFSYIGNVAYEALSVFLDEDADPRTQAYWYKITAVDTAGNESPLDACKPHKTIHLLVTVNPETGWIQLDWDNYIGFDYPTYDIVSKNVTLAEANYTTAHLMASSTSTYSVPSVTDLIYYRVSVERQEMCYPGGNYKADSGPYSHAMSNIEDNRLQTGQLEEKYTGSVEIAPNPFTDLTNIKFNNPEHSEYRMIVYDLAGKIVYLMEGIETDQVEFRRNNLPAGTYLVEIRGSRIYRSVVVIE